ncbi:ferritin family protein [candidate division KSB1 bacterium]|nr:ferritin family protein [candidate division KSB1 bacterium]
MSNDRAVNIVKGAILMEKRGRTFYAQVAKSTKSEAIKKVFDMMVKEEDEHINMLSKHYKKLQEDGTFEAPQYETKPQSFDPSILTQDVQKQITAASYEAAAISAAMAMEEKAVQFYSEQAQKATDPLEQKLFDWLATWEKGHVKLLADIDKELLENIWYDNQFWPE